MLFGFCFFKYFRWDKVRVDYCCMDFIFVLYVKFYSKWFIEFDGIKFIGIIVG